MAKEAQKSKTPRSSSASAAASSNSKATTTVSCGKMELRSRTNESLRRSARLSVASSEKEKKPRSATKPKAKSKKKNVKLDPKIPKKPPTAFFFFLEDFRKEFQMQNPDVKSMRDIGKACGEKWKTMTYEEKVKYYDIATEKRAEFDRAMAEYTKRKESGEYEESEDDSVYDE